MINKASINLSCLFLISVLLFSGACHFKTDPVPFPAQVSEFSKPSTEPLMFSEPKEMNLVPLSPKNTVPPEVKKLDFDKLPSKPFYPDAFFPIQTRPVGEKFDITALRDSVFNLDQIPSRPLKIQTTIIIPPKIVKAALPKLIKNASLGIFEFGEDQGLPGTLVSALMQDSHGMLWIGTDKGLCRFNGEYLEIYSFVGFIFTGSQDYISKIVEDKQGRIWVCTNLQGIYILDARSGIINNFKIPLVNTSFNSVYDMMIDSQGLIWAGNSGSGTWVVNPNEFTFKALKPKENARIGDARQIAEDQHGNIWLSNSTRGIRIVDRTSGKIRFLDQHSGLSSNTITGLHVDKNNRIWIGTDAGTVHIIDLQKGLNFQLSKAQGIDHTITDFVEDDSGNIWMGSAGGLYVYKEGSNRLRYIDTKKGLSNDEIATLFNDDKGQIWIATNSGLNLIDTRGIMPIYLAEKDGLSSGEVWSFAEDVKHRLWIGSIGGVDIYDPTKKTIQSLGADYLLPKAANVSYEFRSRKDGKIMFVSRRSGVQIVDPLKETITNITVSQGLQNTFPSSFMEDNKGRIWTGSFQSRGIEIIDIENKTFTLITRKNGLKGSIVWELNQLSDSVILASTDSALNIINTVNGTISYLMKDNVVRRFNAASVVVDYEGKIWIGEREGVLILDGEKKLLTTIRTENGLVAPDVYTLYKFNGRIYVGTGSGLTVYTPRQTKATEDPIAFNWDFKSYGKAQGMLYNNYNANGAYAFDNKLWWGIEDKALTITDEPKTEWGDTATTHISGITIADVKPSFFDHGWLRNKMAGDTVWNETNDTLYLKDNVSFDKGWLADSQIIWDSITGLHNLPVNLQIPYGLNYVSFQFTGSQFSNRDKSRYRYILEGIDKDWSSVTASSSSKNYRDIPPGSYTFKVVGKGVNDVWSEPSEFSFTILPPWYATWYAYVLYVGAFSLLVWSIVQYRSKQLKKENLILETRVEHRTEQLNKSIGDLKATQSQLIHSEKMASLGELTAGIAHEIQNPLNFVNNFSEVNKELLAEVDEGIEKGNFDEVKNIVKDIISNEEKINHHGKRADAIVRGMLQHSRSSSGVKEPTDINALCDEYLRLSYHGLRARDKTFNPTLNTDYDKTIGTLNIIPQDIGRVILNLINNAFYAVKEKNSKIENGYAPTISVSTKKSGDKILISVKDNGLGIPQSILDKIFQPFFTTKPTGQGTGLGLSLSYDIVKAHGGEIRVETKQGGGSEFVIQVPSISI